MEKKILLQELSDVLADREGLTRKKADAFVKAFFDVVEEALEADKFVKIKGFGTFKLVAVGERESINVNTGERIQIGGHSKISFTPDAFLRDLVNRPFAHFQTVVLNEETEQAELDSVDRMMEELARKEAEENHSEEDVAALSVPEMPERTAASDIPELPPFPPLPDSAVPPPLPFEPQKDEVGSNEPEEENGLAIPPVPTDEEVEASDEAEAEPTPAITPSQINETAQSGMLGPRTSPTNTAASPKIVSIHPINGSPTANTIWNTRYITTRNIGKPSHLLVTIRSMRSDWFFPPESLW